MRNIALALFLFVSVTFAQSSFFRVAHGIANETSLSVVVFPDNITIANGLAFGSISNYVAVTPGTKMVTIKDQNDIVLFSGNVQLNAYTYYTLIGTGVSNTLDVALNISFTLFTDSNSAPTDSTTASIKLVHGIADLGPVDIKFNGNQRFNQIPYKGVSQYTTVSAGTYLVQIIVHGTSDTVNLTLSFQAGGVYTIFAVGIIAGNHQLVLQLDDSYTYPKLRAVHGVLGGNSVNVAIYNPNDNTNQQVATDLVFGAFSAYGTFSVSSSQVVTVIDSTNKLLFKGPISFDPVAPNSLVLFANETSIQYALLKDDVSPTFQYSARVKFFHGVSNAEPVGVRINGVLQIPLVSFGSSSNYVTLSVQRDPSVVDIVTAAGTVLFTVTTAFVSGSSYTIAAFGEAGKPGTAVFVKADSSYDFVSVRFTNAVPNIPTVSLSTDPHASVAIDFGQTISYLVFPIGGLTFTFTYGGNKVLSASPTLVKDTFNSAVLVGVYNSSDPNSVKLQLYTDTVTAPQTSKQVSVRFIHAAPGVGPVTLYGNDEPSFPAVSYLQASNYNNNLVANLQYVIAAMEGNVTLAKTSAFAIGGGVYTIFLFGQVGSASLVPVEDVSYNYFSIRAVHAVPDANAVDIILDDKRNPVNKIFTQVAYKSISQYVQIPMTGLNFTIIVQSGGNTLLSMYYPFASNDAYTVTVTGLVNKYNNQTVPLNINVLTDVLNAPTSSDSTNLRVIHLAPAAPAVDVFLNSVEVTGWNNLAFQASTPYSSQNIVGTNNRIDVYQTGTSTNLLTIPNLAYNGGEVSSIFVFGTPNALAFVHQNDVVYTYFNLRLSHASPDTNPIQALINGRQVLTDNVPFKSISPWTQVVGAATYNVTIIDTTNGAKIIENDVTFQANFDTTIILAGLSGNSTYGYRLLVVSNTGIPPSSFTQSKLRIAHLIPGAPVVDVKFNNFTGVAYNNVGYLTISDYQELPQGVYVADIFTQGSNTSINRHPTLNLTGGASYTAFAEGVLTNFDFVTVVDYFPPSSFNLRVLHASPNVPVVDALVDGSSKGFNGLGFAGGSQYVSFPAGTHDFAIQPTNQKNPSMYYIQEKLTLQAYNDYSILLVGLYNGTNSSALGTLQLTDDNTLPIKAGDVRVRFVHASPNAPPINLRISGVQPFKNVTYKGVTTYTDVASGLLEFDILTTSDEATVLTSTLDLRVRTPGGKAVYTVVAEGIVGGVPPLKLYAFLDNGEMPPDNGSSSQPGSGLSGVAIGLIIAGVAIFVIVVGAAGFIFWKKRHQRAGYSEIEAHSQ